MKQLTLTVYGETQQEILFYLLKLVQKMKSQSASGRIEEMRPAGGGGEVRGGGEGLAITTLGTYRLSGVKAGVPKRFIPPNVVAAARRHAIS